jgi:hypothetical protein
MTPTGGSDQDTHKQRLTQLRDGLLVLHKALIESERIGYEQTFGKLESQQRFLQLLINDPWFAWLHPLSELVVVIDETLEQKELMTAGQVNQILQQARALLKSSEEGHGFPRSYFEALQREPDVVFAHADVMKLLKLSAS